MFSAREKPKKKPAFSFPKLMVHRTSGSIALFLSMVEAIILVNSGTVERGKKPVSIDYSLWNEYYGEVTLKNES